jgi:hypothetical protein
MHHCQHAAAAAVAWQVSLHLSCPSSPNLHHHQLTPCLLLLLLHRHQTFSSYLQLQACLLLLRHLGQLLLLFLQLLLHHLVAPCLCLLLLHGQSLLVQPTLRHQPLLLLARRWHL